MADAPAPVATSDAPFEVELVDGEVVITGPGGLSGSFTPQAAREPARRLPEANRDDDGGTYQKPLG